MQDKYQEIIKAKKGPHPILCLVHGQLSVGKARELARTVSPGTGNSPGKHEGRVKIIQTMGMGKKAEKCIRYFQSENTEKQTQSKR